jgi:hypothetical protein
VSPKLKSSALNCKTTKFKTENSRANHTSFCGCLLLIALRNQIQIKIKYNITYNTTLFSCFDTLPTSQQKNKGESLSTKQASEKEKMQIKITVVSLHRKKNKNKTRNCWQAQEYR